MKKTKLNGGWVAAIIGWIISSILFPFLPEIMKRVIDGVPLGIFGFPLMEYVVTIAFWSVVFLFVWIPAGLKASRIYKEKGLKPSRNYLIVVFLILLFTLSIVFRFFWNS